MTSRRTYNRAKSVSSGTVSVGNDWPRKLNRQKSAVMLNSQVSSPSTETPPTIMNNHRDNSHQRLPTLDGASRTQTNAAGGEIQMESAAPVLAVKLPQIHAQAVQNTGFCLRLVGDWYSGRKPRSNELRELFQRRAHLVK